ncbi:MAG: uncharacterized protein QOI24_3843 [Acidobacteriota bacterium]|jgi:uncharacterized protein (TIGR01777 family)|nr:uncharacterized protein [Acidobacteriota bacterium]
MKIVIAGGSGFIGEPLVRNLLPRGDVVVLSRDASKVRAGRGVAWNPRENGGAWRDDVASADVIINLAGENVGAGRWTAARRQRIIESRVDATRALVDVMRATPRARTFVSASAVGYYGSRGDEVLDERAGAGKGFLVDVTRRWEEEAHRADDVARVVILRFGVVLAADGGALAKMLLPFRLCVGGVIGSGAQWMPWVDRDDVIRFIEWSIDREDARAVYNVAAPSAVTNREFTKALASELHRPAIFPLPAFVLRILFGEMADETLLTSERVEPARGVAEGFTFSYAEVGSSLRHALGR